MVIPARCYHNNILLIYFFQTAIPTQSIPIELRFRPWDGGSLLPPEQPDNYSQHSGLQSQLSGAWSELSWVPSEFSTVEFPTPAGSSTSSGRLRRPGRTTRAKKDSPVNSDGARNQMTRVRNYPKEHQVILKSARVYFIAESFSTGYFWLFKESAFNQVYQLKAVDALFQANASTSIFLCFVLIILNLILVITDSRLDMDRNVLIIVFFCFVFVMI